MVDERCQVVEEGDDELGLVVVAIAELGLRLVAFLGGDERDGRELGQQPLTLLFTYAVLQVVFVEEVVGNLGDVRMAAVLCPKEN